jgi:hypothetical protein
VGVGYRKIAFLRDRSDIGDPAASMDAKIQRCPVGKEEKKI